MNFNEQKHRPTVVFYVPVTWNDTFFLKIYFFSGRDWWNHICSTTVRLLRRCLRPDGGSSASQSQSKQSSSSQSQYRLNYWVLPYVYIKKWKKSKVKRSVRKFLYMYAKMLKIKKGLQTVELEPILIKILD